MNCKDGAITLIDTIISTVYLIDQELYNQPLEVYNGSTLGKHFRHIHDFFHCLIHQCDAPKVDYCKRCRDATIEERKDACIAAFEALKYDMSALNESKMIIVKADFEIGAGVRPEVRTSVGREIMYAYDHAVHHLAIIKIGLNEHCPQIVIDQDLGVAASTIRYNTMS